MKIINQFAVLLQSFFTDYLMVQRQVSQNTIASYRDTFRLFLLFCQKHLKKNPSCAIILLEYNKMPLDI